MAGQVLRDVARDGHIEIGTVGIGSIIGKGDDAYDLYRAGSNAKKAQRARQYIECGKRLFPTRANSGLMGASLRSEQKQFF
jgi:hypothetical protein